MSTEYLDGGPIYESDFNSTAFPPLLVREMRDAAYNPIVRLADQARQGLPLDIASQPAPASYRIVIYLDDGVTFNYDVDSMSSAREHVSAIIATGYRSVQEKQPNILVHYPPHRIQKVKIIAPEAIETGYRDRASGT
ncbi:hypothetical protein CcrColossus_gp145 [Caulobacter phage CcrColossus]|uniref:Uncharacterized protein n=1 Tax=Caulobacter phage CcrColossus TaxID=1211640 RepID=K4JUJ7_9CAUD|nr:hypothetical protein CcrColossus_gp145 [Caulobacter phage CcrColossus]AFU88015.1 hypothetical protein CcrColossus_gp145 [Caulobacter phage CcrColossus]